MLNFKFVAILLMLFPLLVIAQENEWVQRNNGLGNRQVYALAVNPDDPDILYAATSNACYRSANRGANWQQIYQGLPVRDVWVSENGQTVLLALSGGSRSDGIWVSRNDGEFQVMTWILWPTTIAANPDNQNLMFCGSSERGIIYSTNAGGNWQEANVGLRSQNITHINISDFEDDTYIFAGTVRGIHRTIFANNFRWEAGDGFEYPVGQTAFSRDEDGGVFLGTNGESETDGLYYSENMGEEWDDMVLNWGVQAVEAIPGLVIMASREIGVQRSTDNGENWTRMNEELDEFDITDLVIIEDDDQYQLFASTDGSGVFTYILPAEEPEPPSEFDLLLPENNAVVDDLTVNFTWEESVDPNGGEEVSYTFWISTADDSASFSELEISELELTLDSLGIDIEPDAELTWWVIAVSGEDRVECNQRFSLTLDIEIEVILELEQGWNMVSVYLQPDPDDVVTLMQPLVDEDLLLLMKNGLGNFYSPADEFNNIPGWFVDEGYLMKVTESCELTLVGEPVSQDEPINLSAGWQTISCYLRNPVDAIVALSGIVDNLVIAKDGWGNFYKPDWGFCNMMDLIWGRGYMVKMTEDTQLIYRLFLEDDELDHVQQRSVYASPGRLGVHPVTGANMCLMVIAESGFEAPVGETEIGVYASGELVGSGILQGGRCGIAVWGDDPSTAAVDGALDGESLEITILSRGEERIPLFSTLSGEGVYETDAFWVIELAGEGIALDGFALSPPYPNPFNAASMLEFNLPDAGFVEIKIYDLNGRIVEELMSGFVTAGRHSLVVDAAHLPAGIYGVELRSTGRVAVQKMVLLK